MAAHRSVVWPHYHLWTDAIHARHLARNSRNAWDRGTYVRWTVTTSWLVFETTSNDLLTLAADRGSFWGKFDKRFEKLGYPKVGRGSGLWQRVAVLYEARKAYTHSGVGQERLFAKIEEAENAITTIREAIKELHAIANKPTPTWVDDDSNPEEPKGGVALATLVEAGADDDPERIRIVVLYRGREFECHRMLSTGDPDPRVNELIANILVPISAVRVYRRDQLMSETEVRMRGS